MRRLSLFWGDVVILYLSLFTALFIRYGWDIRYLNALEVHLVPFSILFCIWVLAFYIANLYEIEFAKNRIEFYSALSYSFITSALISILFFYFFRYFAIAPKTNLFLFLIIGAVLMTLWRYYFNHRAKKSLGYNTLFLGLNEQSQQMYDYLLANPQLGYNALGIIDTIHYTAPEILKDIIRQKKIDTLILGPESYKVSRIINILYGLVGSRISFYNLSDFYEMVTGKVPLGAIDQAWFLENLSENKKRVYDTGKRVFDVFLSLIIGTVFLPFFPFVALVTKLNSPGPVFFKQKRIGKAGKTFTVIKFRTMITNSSDGSAEGSSGPVWASANDKRTTKVGKIFRKTRIDEIPQIWNIIKGEMSFVGPRPERPEFHEKLRIEVPFYEERCLIKPGLTGWAQIKYKVDFKDGMTVKDTFEKVQHDLYYIKNRSLVLDIGIILKTINIILQKLFAKTKDFLLEKPSPSSN